MTTVPLVTDRPEVASVQPGRVASPGTAEYRRRCAGGARGAAVLLLAAVACCDAAAQQGTPATNGLPEGARNGVMDERAAAVLRERMTAAFAEEDRTLLLRRKETVDLFVSMGLLLQELADADMPDYFRLLRHDCGEAAATATRVDDVVRGRLLISLEWLVDAIRSGGVDAEVVASRLVHVGPDDPVTIGLSISLGGQAGPDDASGTRPGRMRGVWHEPCVLHRALDFPVAPGDFDLTWNADAIRLASGERRLDVTAIDAAAFDNPADVYTPIESVGQWMAMRRGAQADAPLRVEELGVSGEHRNVIELGAPDGRLVRRTTLRFRDDWLESIEIDQRPVQLRHRGPTFVITKGDGAGAAGEVSGPSEGRFEMVADRPYLLGGRRVSIELVPLMLGGRRIGSVPRSVTVAIDNLPVFVAEFRAILPRGDEDELVAATAASLRVDRQPHPFPGVADEVGRAVRASLRDQFAAAIGAGDLDALRAGLDHLRRNLREAGFDERTIGLHARSATEQAAALLMAAGHAEQAWQLADLDCRTMYRSLPPWARLAEAARLLDQARSGLALVALAVSAEADMPPTSRRWANRTWRTLHGWIVDPSTGPSPPEWPMEDAMDGVGGLARLIASRSTPPSAEIEDESRDGNAVGTDPESEESP